MPRPAREPAYRWHYQTMGLSRAIVFCTSPPMACSLAKARAFWSLRLSRL